MIKLSYARLVQIAGSMGVKPADNYDTLISKLEEHGITVTTKAIPPGYILTFLSDQHETVFRIKHSEVLDKIVYDYKSDIIVLEQD